MTNNKKFSKELKEVFEYIKEDIIPRYNISTIDCKCFMLAAMEHYKSKVYNVLVTKLNTTQFDELHDELANCFECLPTQYNENVVFDRDFTVKMEELQKNTKPHIINSCNVMSYIIRKNKNIAEMVSKYNISYTDFECAVGKKKTTKEQNDVSDNIKKIKIDEYIGGEDLYEELFIILSKKNAHNAVITGEHGIGRTTFVRNIDNRISSGLVPETFKNHKVTPINDILLGFSNDETEYKPGNFKNKALLKVNFNKEILFIDDIEILLTKTSNIFKFYDAVEEILSNPNITTIIVADIDRYEEIINSHPQWESFFENIELPVADTTRYIDIAKLHISSLSLFHNVEYTDESLEMLLKMCKKHDSEWLTPYLFITLVDELGALVENTNRKPDNITDIEKSLSELDDKISYLRKNNNNTEICTQIDTLVREQIALKSELNKKIKEHMFNRKPTKVTTKHVLRLFTLRTGIPMEELDDDKKKSLKDICNKIKKNVVGQDEAVNEICTTIRRQRVGLSDTDKPAVFLFAGHTGVGKTYVAKQVAKEVFGSEKNMVRIDMGEYSDKTSTNKLIGASTGYVGYENGGILTEAVKKNKQCVLLLDEIEKADENVHNLMLSVFDEGRLTDNKGFTVDFSDAIIIMTSNIGAREVDERGNGIGFNTDSQSLSKNIINKELRRKFTPEFINRIDNIVFFNRLSDDDMKKIIVLEIEKIQKRVEDIGYFLDDNVKDDDLVDIILEKAKTESKYGARPILRILQRMFIDRITDMILDENIPKGYKFTSTDIVVKLNMATI